MPYNRKRNKKKKALTPAELKAKREAIFSRPLSEVPGTLEYAKLHGGPIHAPNRNVLFAKTN